MIRLALGLAASAATTVVLVAQLGRTDPLLDLLNVALPLLLPLLALILACALRTRDRITIAVAVIGLAVGGWQFGQAALEGHDTQAPGPRAIKVLTLSTFHANPDPQAIRAVIAAQAPDIAMLQETNGRAAPIVDALLPRYHRVKSCKTRHCTLTILSRWPMRLVTPRYTPRQPQPDLVIGEVQAPFGRFRVMNIHMPRPYKPEAPQYLAEIARIGRANRVVPLIMAGDFNTAAGSFALQRFAGASGLQRRDGFIPTYPANRRVVAVTGIDHVFADERWASSGCRRTAAGRSDHYGVACRLRLEGQRGLEDLPKPAAFSTPERPRSPADKEAR